MSSATIGGIPVGDLVALGLLAETDASLPLDRAVRVVVARPGDGRHEEITATTFGEYVALSTLMMQRAREEAVRRHA